MSCSRQTSVDRLGKALEGVQVQGWNHVWLDLKRQGAQMGSELCR